MLETNPSYDDLLAKLRKVEAAYEKQETELHLLRLVRDAASPVAEFLHWRMSNIPGFDIQVRALIAALDAHRAHGEIHG